jgi:hypothetical protein
MMFKDHDRQALESSRIGSGEIRGIAQVNDLDKYLSLSLNWHQYCECMREFVC